MKPGLWIDSGQIGVWTIWDNPAVKNARTSSGGLCRASDAVSRLYLEGFTRQIRENGVRLLKFDNLLDRCDEPGHDHLPGDYSTEPICNHIIQLYRDLDRLCPDVMIMLYWRYQSPWWLEHADTLFDIGTKIEAASFAPWPTFRARDSVTRRLDEARWMVKDIPTVGWDPLGIWLSDWPWNSCMGKEAWQTGMVMDLCRGHLLAQIWSDAPVLTPPERAQAAEFIALLKARPECFGNSRFILGNPWKNEPYGYCCSDGRRAFLAINNGVLRDTTVELSFGPALGLPQGKRWDLYRRYPRPAQLRQGGQGFASSARLALRAMEIVLLEVVPQGEAPTLDRKFDIQEMPATFAEATSGADATRTRSGKSADGGMASARPCGETLPSERRSTGDKDGRPVGDKHRIEARGASVLYSPSGRESEVFRNLQREAGGISAGRRQWLVSGGMADVASGRSGFGKASAVRFSDSQRRAGGCGIPGFRPFRASVVAFWGPVLRGQPEQIEIRSKGDTCTPPVCGNASDWLSLRYLCRISLAKSVYPNERLRIRGAKGESLAAKPRRRFVPSLVPSAEFDGHMAPDLRP